MFVSTPQLPIHNALAQVAVAALRQAGMNADLQMGDWPVVLQRINTRSPIGCAHGPLAQRVQCLLEHREARNGSRMSS